MYKWSHWISRSKVTFSVSSSNRKNLWDKIADSLYFTSSNWNWGDAMLKLNKKLVSSLTLHGTALFCICYRKGFEILVFLQ